MRSAYLVYQPKGVKVQSALPMEKITLPHRVKIILSCMAGIRVSSEGGLAEFKMATKTPKSSIVMCFRFNRLLGLCTHIFTYIFDKLMISFTIRNIEKSTAHCWKSQSCLWYTPKQQIQEMSKNSRMQERSRRFLRN